MSAALGAAPRLRRPPERGGSRRLTALDDGRDMIGFPLMVL